MSYIRLLFVCIVLMPAFAFTQSYYWKDINGSPNYSLLSEGGGGKLFATFGTFSGTDSKKGLYYSNDDGLTWIKTGINGYIEELEANGDKIIVTLPDQYQNNYTRYYSSDNGSTWLVLNRSTLPFYFNITDSGNIMALNFYNDGTVQPVRYEIASRRWRNFGTSLTIFDYVLFFKIDAAMNFYIGNYQTGMYISTDYGSTWNHVLQNQGVRSISFKDTADIVVATVTYDTTTNGVFRSSDAGSTWTYLGLESTNKGEIVKDNSGRIYANTENGIYRYSGSGMAWHSIGPERALFDDILITSKKTIIASGTALGLYRSTDYGNTWAKTTTMRTEVVTALCIDNYNTVFAGTTENRLFLSSNSGAGWYQVPEGTVPNEIISLLSLDTAVYAGTYDGLFRTTDRGNSWKNLTQEYVGGAIYSLASNGGGELFAASNFGVYKSTDGGETWCTSGLSSLAIHNIVVMQDDHVMVSTVYDGVYTSTNAGETWNYSGLTDASILALCVNNQGDVFAGGFGYVYRSTDRGSTWSSKTVDTCQLLSLLATEHDIFVGSFNGIFVSRDKGDTWTRLSTSGLTGATILSLVADKQNNIIAGVNQGGVFMTSAPFTDIKPLYTIPTQTTLYQNYPNPFNPLTTISFDMASAGYARVQIIDLTGRVVATLADGYQTAGRKEIQWNAHDFPGGIYFYRLQSATVSVTRKLVLIK